MESGFYTLQEFMLFTKGVTYIIMVISLFAITGFWLFLTGRDEDPVSDKPADTTHHHQGGDHV